MQSVTRGSIALEHRLEQTYRVGRILGAFNDPPPTKFVKTLEFDEPPSVDEEWRVGLIVGRSGSGKSTVARSRYADAEFASYRWNDRAVVDNFAPRPFDEIADALAAVGFSSLPCAARPYATLSGGERFRCDVAKALLDARKPIVVVDEFASVVDPDVARSASLAVRKAIDRGAFGKTRLIAIACRERIAEWLQPDWVLDMDSGLLTRGRLRRPKLQIRVYEGKRRHWDAFKDCHYLSGTLMPAVRVRVATISTEKSDSETLAAFAAIMQVEGRKGLKRVHRLVVAPQFQGIGIGSAFLDALGEMERERDARLTIVTGNAFFVRKLARSRKWRFKGAYPNGKTQRRKGRPDVGSFGRAVAAFEYGDAENERPPPSS